MAGIRGELDAERKARGGGAMSSPADDGGFLSLSESVDAHGEPHGSSIMFRDYDHIVDRSFHAKLSIVRERGQRGRIRKEGLVAAIVEVALC
jgi:hypothetical protein